LREDGLREETEEKALVTGPGLDNGKGGATLYSKGRGVTLGEGFTEDTSERRELKSIPNLCREGSSLQEIM
jgi:hypothetical protein